LAEKLLKQTVKELGIKNYKILEKFKGQSLLNYKALHPLPESLPSDAVGSSVVVLADFVESDQGTGVVHIAPGHGFEDYLIGKKYNLPLCSPVDQKGIFTKEAGKFSGLHVFKANEPIIESLKNRGILLGSGKIIHSYPCCWRCKNPIIFRATKQWFIKTKALRTKAINLIKKVKWIPAEGLERMELMLLEKPDWCISRQRKWGIPIPSLICQSCHENILEPKVINNVREIVLKEGSDAWFEHDLKKFLPTGFKCPKCGSNKFKKGKDILDVWFDSGISFLALVAIHKGLSYPSDLYLEGSDQHRGWFQSSLLTNVGFKGTSPYKAVLTHGFTVDDKGNKMSKSLGNVVDPLKVQEIFGNEILRLWAASVDYSLDVSISSPKLKKDTAPILEQVSEMYFKLRNTLRFILGNLHDFDYKKDELDYKDWQEIDKWIIAELQNLIDDYNHYFKEFKFYKAVNKIYYFSTVTLSAIYFDILKDRLYTYDQKSKDRLSAQNALSVIFTSLVSMLTPVLSFTTEEAWSSFPKFKNKSKSSLFLPWIYKDKRYENSVLIEKYKIFLSFRDKVNESLDKARRQKIVSSSLEAKAELIIKSKKEYELFKKYEKDLPSIFIVSQIQLKKANKDSIQISKASGKKCIRCWKYSKTVGQAKLHPEICNDCLEVINKYNR
jgi:isoleucyl-tRNA synthetase